MLWVVFNSNGQFISSYNVGNLPYAGTNDFQIFAYFKDLPSGYTGGAMKLYKPDLQRNSYVPLIMTNTSQEYTGATNENLTANQTYPGFLFDFSKVSVPSLLDTAGMWRAAITLFSGADTNLRDVVGSVTFEVGNGIESPNGVSISEDETLLEVYAAIAKKLDINGATDPKYIKTIESAQTWSMSPLYSVGDILMDRNTKFFYQISENNELHFIGSSSDTVNLIELTYNQLKTLRDEKKLVPGMQYKITDYECTTVQEDTMSAGHNFDIIVVADNEDTLNENARACMHEGDTYFARCNLDAWQLKYCLDNDTTRFGWAQVPTEEHLVYNNYSFFREPQYDGVNGNYCWKHSSYYIFTDTLDAPTTGSYWRLTSSWIKYYDDISVVYVPNILVEGKGVVYRMIDEFGNDIPYDFKNILFTKSGSYTNVYTFSYTESSVIKDASLLASTNCYNNVMKMYTISSKKRLNFNVFYSTNTNFSCHGNTFNTNCINNTFGDNCYNNTFGDNCYNNTFGNNGSANTFGNDCHDNTFGTGCFDNIFGSSCSRNTFGNDCYDNIFGTGCYDNIFDNNCIRNIFGFRCFNNTFGAYCQNNKFGNYCQNITFGSYCSSNTFGVWCTYITFGDSSSTINYCSDNRLDDGCHYLYINGNGTASSSNELQYVHIHSGVKGSSSVNPINITATRNLDHVVDYYPAGSEIKEI